MGIRDFFTRNKKPEVPQNNVVYTNPNLGADNWANNKLQEANNIRDLESAGDIQCFLSSQRLDITPTVMQAEKQRISMGYSELTPKETALLMNAVYYHVNINNLIKSPTLDEYAIKSAIIDSQTKSAESIKEQHKLNAEQEQRDAYVFASNVDAHQYDSQPATPLTPDMNPYIGEER